MPVLHPKPARYRAELCEAESLIKMPCMNIALHDCIELKHSKAQLFSHLQTILYQLFSDVSSSCIRGDGKAGIADMSASSNIVRMKNIQTIDPSVFFRNPGITLSRKERCTAFQIQGFFLWKSDPFFNDFIPDPDHGIQILRQIRSDYQCKAPQILFFRSNTQMPKTARLVP